MAIDVTPVIYKFESVFNKHTNNLPVKPFLPESAIAVKCRYLVDTLTGGVQDTTDGVSKGVDTVAGSM
jgi:hypothetical protein